MRKPNLAFIDIETTGLDVMKHEIIEIGCIIVDEFFNVVGEFDLKIKPKHMETADPVSLRINHYNPREWESAYSLEDGLKILVEKTGNTMMAGFNIPFDASFLNRAFYDTGIKSNFLNYYLIDVVSIAFAKLYNNKTIEKFTLHELCDYFKIKNEKEHTALADIRATFELYKKLMEL